MYIRLVVAIVVVVVLSSLVYLGVVNVPYFQGVPDQDLDLDISVKVEKDVAPSDSAPTVPASVDATVTLASALRTGPDVLFDQAAIVRAGETVTLDGCNSDCTWYRTVDGYWLAGYLMAGPLPALRDVSPVVTPVALVARAPNPPSFPTATPIPEAVSIRLPTPTPEPAEPVVLALPQPAPLPFPAPGNTTTNEVANLRNGPGTAYEKVGVILAGDPVSIVARTVAGDWYQMADGKWIAAFLVDNAPGGLQISVDFPEPPPPTPMPGGFELEVNFLNPRYDCVQSIREVEDAQGEVEKIGTYRSFQVDMSVKNLIKDPFLPIWKPSYWVVTDGVNDRTVVKSWQWLGQGSAYTQQPGLHWGMQATWTWVVLPIERDEWVKSVIYDWKGQIYRADFDLGEAGNAFNYRDCGESRVE